MIDVLFVDNHLFVLAKPHGLLSQADATGDPDVLSIAREEIRCRFEKPGNVFAGLVHRLDRPASGVMVVARTSKAAARLSRQFRERSPSKSYLAIVEGRATIDGTLADHLLADERHVRIARPDEAGAQRAVLSARVLATGERRGGEVSLVSIELQTGRKHQIRVQLAHRGHPIIGDMRYGASMEYDGRNLALHAWRLQIEHPTRKETMAWTARPASLWFELFGDALDAFFAGQPAGKE